MELNFDYISTMNLTQYAVGDKFLCFRYNGNTRPKEGFGSILTLGKRKDDYGGIGECLYSAAGDNKYPFNTVIYHRPQLLLGGGDLYYPLDMIAEEDQFMYSLSGWAEAASEIADRYHDWKMSLIVKRIEVRRGLR